MLWNMKFCNLLAVVKETFPKTLLFVMIKGGKGVNLIISDQLLGICPVVWRSYHMNHLGYRTAGFFEGGSPQTYGPHIKTC